MLLNFARAMTGTFVDSTPFTLSNILDPILNLRNLLVQLVDSLLDVRNII